MKRFLLGVVAGLIIAVVSGVVLLFATMKFASRAPSIPDKTCLVVRLEGPLPETAPPSFPLPAFESRSPLTVLEVQRALKAAANDPRVKGVVLQPRGVGAGWAKLEEIRAAIAEVRKAGKPVYAWLQSPGMREYYLAAGAEKVFLSPEDMLNVKGMRIEAMYFKGTLDKVGVEVEVEHAGKYKDAGDIFSRTSMTPETREALNSILDDLYPRLLTGIGAGRKKTPEQMRALVDDGPFLAPKALETGLVDELIYERAVSERMARQTDTDIDQFTPIRKYLEAGAWSPKGTRRKIAVLVAQGDILRVGSTDTFGEEEIVTPATISRYARRIAEDTSIAGVVVRVDSPGGDAIASDEILQELKKLSERKPLVFSMSDLAASGGYYIAMTGDPVIAQAGTLTGSIGVVFGKVNLKGLYSKLGISVETLKRGRYADIDSSAGPMTPEARVKLREGIDFIYKGFVRKVADGRKRKVEEIEPLAQGRVWLGSQAKERGLVDHIGGFDTALEVLREKAKLGKDAVLALEVYPPKRSLFDQLFTRGEEMMAPPSTLRALLKQAGPGVAPYLAGGMLRVAPYRVEID